MDGNPERVVSIKVIGVGGAGNNVINHMVDANVDGVDFVAMNTDKQDLNKSKAPVKVQIGEKLTGGRGAGSKPEIGKKSAEESRAEIAKLVEGCDMVFVTAGMGGGTGTGAAPIVADIARESGALTVGVVTKPFKFEGAHRMQQAEEGIANLKDKVDSLVVIPNERLKLVSDEKITFLNAFSIADDVLKEAVTSIYELVSKSENVVINLDFADISSVMKNSGRAHMGVATANGKDKAEMAATHAVKSPLLETEITGATGVLINVNGPADMQLDEVEKAAQIVTEAANPDANIIVGAAIDPELEDTLRVTVIATGFDTSVPESAEAENSTAEAANDSDIDEIFRIFNGR